MFESVSYNHLLKLQENSLNNSVKNNLCYFTSDLFLLQVVGKYLIWTKLTR